MSASARIAMDAVTLVIIAALVLATFFIYKFIMKTTKFIMKTVVFGVILLVLYGVLVSRGIIPGLF